MTKKKLCLVIHALSPGGMERVMSELAWHFSRTKDVELHLILYGIKRDIFYPVPDSVIIHRPPFPFDNRRRLLSTVRTLWFLRQKIKAIDPDSVLSFGEYWNNFVLLALMGLKYPVYVSERSQPDKSLGRWQDQLRKWLYPRATGVIAQTQVARDIYSRMFSHRNIEVIGNPIRAIEPLANGAQRENIVLSVGRLIVSKHHDLLIDIFTAIDKSDWKLIILGGDSLKQNGMERLTRKIEEMGVTDRVILAGTVANVDDYYRRSKIFAFTSSSEGFPNVIGEAMSAGLPVVTFDCVAGPADLVTDGEDGFLVPLFDSTIFRQKLELLMDNEALRESMGAKAQRNVQRFSAPHIGDHFYHFITAG